MPFFRLSPSNEEKLRKASIETDRSMNDLLNMLIDMMENMTIKQAVKVKLKQDPSSSPDEQPRKKIIRKTTHRFVKF